MFSFNSEFFLRYFHFNSVDDSVYTNQDQSRPLMNLYFALFTELEKDTYDLWTENEEIEHKKIKKMIIL